LAFTLYFGNYFTLPLRAKCGLEAMVDSLFDLLPEPTQFDDNISKRKLLTFSDDRQDAAFFASEY
jgi:hypothetical protein